MHVHAGMLYAVYLLVQQFDTCTCLVLVQLVESHPSRSCGYLFLNVGAVPTVYEFLCRPGYLAHTYAIEIGKCLVNLLILFASKSTVFQNFEVESSF